MKKIISVITIIAIASMTTFLIGQNTTDDKSPRATYLQGEKLVKDASHDQALPLFEKAYAEYSKDSIKQKTKCAIGILTCYEKRPIIEKMEVRLPEFQAIVDQLPADDIDKGMYYNAVKNVYYAARKYTKCIKFTDLFIENLELQEKKDWEWLFKAKRTKGDCYSHSRNFDEALKISKEYNQIAVEHLSDDKLIQMLNLNSQGLMATLSGDYENSLKHYLEAEKLIPELSDSILQEKNIAAVIYSGIAASYMSTGDLHKAMPYFYKSYEILKAQGNKRGIIVTLINIGGIHEYQGNIDEAALVYDEAKALALPTFGENSFYMNTINFSYAGVLSEKGNYKEALDLYDDVLLFHSKGTTSNDIIQSAETHKFISLIYLYKLEEFKNADFHLEKAIKLIGQIEKQDRYSQYLLARLYDLKSIKMMLDPETKNFDNALEYTRKSIGIAVSNSNYQLGDPIDRTNLTSYFEILKSLRTVFLLYHKKYKNEDNKELLEMASYYSNTTDALLDSLLADNYFNPESIQSLAQSKIFAYSENVYTELQLDENKDRLDKAFYFAEKSKSLTLLQGVREEKIKELSGITEDLSNNEKKYKEDISRNKNLISDLKDSDKSTLDSLQNEITKLTIKQGELVENIKNNYPDYYKMKYDYKLTNIKEIQNNISDSNTAIIQYAFDSYYTNAFLIQEKNTDFIAKGNPDDIDGLIYEYIELLKKNETDKKRQLELSQHLYNYFVSPIIANTDENIDHLVIIPTSTLNHLPFETLQDSTGRYLIQDYNISYAYSSTSLLEQINKPNSNNRRGFGGFAAEYNQDFVDPDTLTNSILAELIRNGEYNLPGAISEVENISQLLSGDQFMGKEATVSNFKEIANQYKVLHLAMHSNLNENTPLLSSLLFSKLDDETNELTATDLYGLRLDADLVVLSACNTGSGKLQKGEGIMSLSRAFTYAGVPSTVMSLWKVPDASTSKIMISFYEYLKEGKPKDEALRLAKLDYLENIETPEAAHPFYWAGFVLSGDTEPIADSFSAGTPWVFYLVIAGLFIAFAYMFLFRKNKN